MAQDPIAEQILDHVQSEGYTPSRPRQLAKRLGHDGDAKYGTFRAALRDLMDHGRVVAGSEGNVLIPTDTRDDEMVGSYRHNPRGFGFVVPSDPGAHEDLFIPPGHNMGALSGDVVRCRVYARGKKDGKDMFDGEVLEILERTHTRFAGTLARAKAVPGSNQRDTWYVEPDGNTLTDPILTPDAAGRHIKPGTKVIVEITQYPEDKEPAVGVITEVLGEAGDKDVDLQSVIVQFNLPEDFPQHVKDAASRVVSEFDAADEKSRRLDLTDELIVTIDPPDAKDYDDAISVTRNQDGTWELGVHIADVSHFVKTGGPIDEEAKQRGNSTYFPGHVIPMLPEILSNGVCSLQAGVDRLAKSCFITLETRNDGTAHPVGTAFSNSVLHSAQRFRYIEAQAIIDGDDVIPHPDGDRTVDDYDEDVVQLLRDMNTLAKQIQKRRKQQGQLNLDLPSINLVLNDEGKVVGTEEEDDAYTHTIIEMFMVEANEAAARLYDRMNVPYLRRTHPGPDGDGEERLKNFVAVAGHKLPADMDRQALQGLLAKIKGRPEQFAINFAILKSLSRAEYSPKKIGHFALASENYSHFTSPIRRYADLTVHRLLDDYFDAIRADFSNGPVPPPKTGHDLAAKLKVPTLDDLVEMGRHISFTERRSESAERELRQVKVLQLLEDHVGQDYDGVVTGIVNFGLFIQIQEYLVEGLVRFDELLDDWWDVDPKRGLVKGQRTGRTIRIGDVVHAKIVGVDVPKRELSLAVLDVKTRGETSRDEKHADKKPKLNTGKFGDDFNGSRRTGSDKRAARSKSRDNRKADHRGKRERGKKKK
jgi:ribonuclease R